jgi:hypothetical protein
MILRFVHLSDIHFGQEKNGTLILHDHIRNSLVKDIEQLAKQRGSATRVLVTGDIAFSGQPAEYATAAQWLEKVTTAAQCAMTHVSTIPGNHDCDLDVISSQAKMIYGQLRGCNPETLQAFLHQIHADGEAASPFLPKLHAYRQFANVFGCDFDSADHPAWVKDIDLPGGIKLKFFGLNSVQISDKGDAVGKMALGNKQYIIDEESNVINVVLVHHPLDWFIDEKEASQFLYKNTRVIMVGHEHSLAIEKVEDAFTKRQRLAIFAGATSPDDPEYGYMYNWMEFSCQEKDGEHFLNVEVFPRAWNKNAVCFNADYERLGGGTESVGIRIHCPTVKPQLDQVDETEDPPTDKTPQTEPMPTAATTEVASPQSVFPKQAEAAMSIDSAAFDRFRYLFWRYLDWRQRLEVLVNAKALPEAADQPVPQTLERVALEAAARTPGKLHELWNAIMPLVPDEKRGNNPFPTKGSE